MSKAISPGLTAIVSVLLSLPVSANQAPYKIAVVPWAGWSPVHVAEAKGFWRELGVDVEVANLESNIQMNQALIAGDVTIQFDMLGTAVGRFQEGHHEVIIAETDWSDGGDKIIAKKGLDLAAHKSNTVGVYLDEPSLGYFLNCYLSTHGLQVADFTLQQETPDVGLRMFVENQFKVLMAYDPFATAAVEKGAGVVVATSADYPGSVPEGMLMLQATYEQTPKADLEKIIQGWAKAATWSADPDNWQEYQQILNDRTFAGDNPR
ncbi:MAG TPA: ABC transporter substrate-binding protein, partial [Vicinamibacteria bacterium]|nr:ABC transporter substrate-binding protein [Vicinamibacteria bacterium]